MRPVKAMILAAGRGERMRPHTDSRPKPMLPVNGKPLIERHLERLHGAGVEEVVINLGWLGEVIREHVGDGGDWSLRVQYSVEGWPALESGGGIFHALHLLGAAPFVVVNGDVWTDYPLGRLVQRAATLANDALAHLVLVRNPSHNPKGDFVLENGRVGNAEAGRHTFSGLSVHRPELFRGCSPGHFPLLPLWRKAAERGALCGEVYEGAWSDVGTPERLDQLEQRLRAGT